jgi:hypothetical protein
MLQSEHWKRELTPSLAESTLASIAIAFASLFAETESFKENMGLLRFPLLPEVHFPPVSWI